jgi:hypothetical protein
MGRFLARAMSEGAQWLWRLLTHFLTLVTLFAVAAGVIVAGVLLHRAAWLIAAAAIVLIFVVFAKGAYIVWHVTHKELTEAREELVEAIEASAGYDLKLLLNAGLKLQGLLDVSEEVSPRVSLYKGDPVYEWARETWEALQRENPAAAKAIFGDRAPYYDGYFETAFVLEAEHMGRRTYLDDRVAILERAVAASFPK